MNSRQKFVLAVLIAISDCISSTCLEMKKQGVVDDTSIEDSVDLILSGDLFLDLRKYVNNSLPITSGRQYISDFRQGRHEHPILIKEFGALFVGHVKKSGLYSDALAPKICKRVIQKFLEANTVTLEQFTFVEVHKGRPKKDTTLSVKYKGTSNV